MNTRYEQIVDVDNIASFAGNKDIQEVMALTKNEQLPFAAHDEKRTLLLAIDLQNDFMENIGTLPVQGSKGDVERLTRWMYNNMAKLTKVMCSLDCHTVSQIFHAAWWTDASGNNPEPFTVITYQDVLDGKWKAANGENKISLDYLKNLESDGKKQLCIWPYHCLEGTDGARLDYQFKKMLYFHATARISEPVFIQKGQNPYTEMYGIIKGENDEDGFINQEVLDAIKQYDNIYIAGEASSHCVLASVEQILEYFADNRDITSRITVLEDCMSPITGFEEATKQRFQELEQMYGIRIEKSTDVKL